MDNLKIHLSTYPERFSENSFLIDITEKVNFIYGKNGTGKSTIANTIYENFSGKYNVFLFDGFESVISENHRLDAISLGKINTEVQKEIDLVSAEIFKIKLDIEKPESGIENTYTYFEKANINFIKHEKAIKNYYTSAARQIKNKKIENINIAKPSYNKDVFYKEISYAKDLSKEEISYAKEIIKSDRKIVHNEIDFPDINLKKCLEETNSLLKRVVTQKEILEELNTRKKEEFVRLGLDIHEKKIGEKCSFCGNKISEERWIILGKIFNDDVKEVEKNIKEYISKLEGIKSKLDVDIFIDHKKYYKQFEEQILTLNIKIKAKVGDYLSFITTLISSLKVKLKNIFDKNEILILKIEENFEQLQLEYRSINKDNNSFSENLIKEQESAINSLRYNEIKNILDTFNYEKNIKLFDSLKSKRDEMSFILDRKKEELNSKQILKNELILQTVNEEIIASQINNLLDSMGIMSFSLQLVTDDNEDQKGQYQIKGHNGVIRSVTKLSKGEKNIIAFLYFLLSLEKVNDDLRPKIVIFDDPMTSNDDTMQYLMISELQKLYRKLPNECYMFIFTHNCHFYLNVRPNTSRKYKLDGEEISYYDKFGNYHMLSDGKRTIINRIRKGKKDFRTNYEMLWRELSFLYDSNEPNLMLNVCRKICETFMHFTKKDVQVFYKNNIGAKKLFDVNQHSIDDLEAEQNGRNKEEIIRLLKELFIVNNAEEHFTSYFKLN